MNAKPTLRLSALLILVGTCISSYAQNIPKPVSPERKLEILIPISVSDKDHNPVHGLGKQDVTVLVNGKSQEVLSVEEDNSEDYKTLQNKTVGAKTLDDQTNILDSKDDIVVILIRSSNLLIDTENKSIANLAGGKVVGPIPQSFSIVVSKVLEAQTANTIKYEVVALEKSGLRIIQGRTLDAAKVATAIQEYEKYLYEHRNTKKDDNPPWSDELFRFLSMGLDYKISVEHRNTDPKDEAVTLNAAINVEAFLQIAQAYSGIPGRKTLIWYADDNPFSMETKSGKLMENFNPAVPYMLQMLKEVGFSLYPIKIRAAIPDNNSVPPPPPPAMVNFGPYDRNQRTSLAQIQYEPGLYSQFPHVQIGRVQNFRYLAEHTDGHAYDSPSDLKRILATTSKDKSTSYKLKISFDSNVAQSEWKDVKVSSPKQNLEIYSSNGFYSGFNIKPDTLRTVDLALALQSPLQFTSVPLKGSIGGPKALPGNEKQFTVPFHVFLPAGMMTFDVADGNRLYLDFIYSVSDENNHQVSSNTFPIDLKVAAASRDDLRANGINFDKSFTVPSGNYTVKFILRDNMSGKIGSLIIPLKVP